MSVTLHVGADWLAGRGGRGRHMLSSRGGRGRHTLSIEKQT